MISEWLANPDLTYRDVELHRDSVIAAFQNVNSPVTSSLLTSP